MTFTVDEPDELPTALPRDVIFVDCVRFELHLNKRMFRVRRITLRSQNLRLRMGLNQRPPDNSQVL